MKKLWIIAVILLLTGAGFLLGSHKMTRTETPVIQMTPAPTPIPPPMKDIETVIKEMESTTGDPAIRIEKGSEEITLCGKDYRYSPIFINEVDILKRIGILSDPTKTAFEFCRTLEYVVENQIEDGSRPGNLVLKIKKAVIDNSEQKQPPKIAEGLYRLEIYPGALFRIDLLQNKIFNIGYIDINLGPLK